MLKSITVLIALLSASVFVNAATVQGTCLDENDNPVGYVNIAVEGTSTRILSQKDGSFRIAIPDSQRDREVTFSHISYEITTTPADFFLEQPAGSDVKVIMRDRTYNMPDAAVTAERVNLIDLNDIGKQRTFVVIEMSFNNDGYEPKGRKSNFYGLKEGLPDPYENSIGQRVTIDKKAVVKELQFEVDVCKYDSLLMRAVLYKVTDEGYEPLMKEPHYFGIPHKTFLPQTIFCDLSQYNIVAQGDIIVNLEYIYSEAKNSKKQLIRFPLYKNAPPMISFFYPGPEEMFVNDVDKSRYLDEGIGLQLRGYYLD